MRHLGLANIEVVDADRVAWAFALVRVAAHLECATLDIDHREGVVAHCDFLVGDALRVGAQAADCQKQD